MPRSERMGVGDFIEDVARAYIRYREDKRLVAEGRSAQAEEEVFSRTERFEYDETMSNYDDARPIERPRGSFVEFLGECGMEVFSPRRQETDRAQSIGLWLFDKEDIRTKTLVLVPEKLSDKDPDKAYFLSRGEVFVIEQGVWLPPVALSSLTMLVKVAEVELGRDQKTEKPYFARLVVEVTVTPTAKE